MTKQEPMTKKISVSNIDEDEVFIWNEFFNFDIQPYTKKRVFTSGDDILREGERPAYLYYMISGKAKLYLTHENGRISLINFLNAPCFIGEMELLDEEKYSDGVRAITECVCYAIHVEDCRDKLFNDTKFLRYLCNFLSRKAIANTANYSRNQSYPLKERLAGFILETSVNGMYREQHTEVAEYLGVTYRHLLYVMARLVKDGILEKTKAGYRIVDAERLLKPQD